MVKHEYGGYDLYLPRVQKANSLKGRKNQICEWSEWTDFNNCTEISYQVCKKIRVRTSNNCENYYIEAKECTCSTALEKEDKKKTKVFEKLRNIENVESERESSIRDSVTINVPEPEIVDSNEGPLIESSGKDEVQINVESDEEDSSLGYNESSGEASDEQIYNEDSSGDLVFEELEPQEETKSSDGKLQLKDIKRSSKESKINGTDPKEDDIDENKDKQISAETENDENSGFGKDYMDSQYDILELPVDKEHIQLVRGH